MNSSTPPPPRASNWLVSPFVIGWSRYSLGIPQSKCLLGSCDWWDLLPFIKGTLTVPLHSPNGRQMPAISAVQGDCERVYTAPGPRHCCHPEWDTWAIQPANCSCSLYKQIVRSAILWSLSNSDFKQKHGAGFNQISVDVKIWNWGIPPLDSSWICFRMHLTKYFFELINSKMNILSWTF